MEWYPDPMELDPDPIEWDPDPKRGIKIRFRNAPFKIALQRWHVNKINYRVQLQISQNVIDICSIFVHVYLGFLSE